MRKPPMRIAKTAPTIESGVFLGAWKRDLTWWTGAESEERTPKPAVPSIDSEGVRSKVPSNRRRWANFASQEAIFEAHVGLKGVKVAKTPEDQYIAQVPGLYVSILIVKAKSKGSY